MSFSQIRGRSDLNPYNVTSSLIYVVFYSCVLWSLIHFTLISSLQLKSRSPDVSWSIISEACWRFHASSWRREGGEQLSTILTKWQEKVDNNKGKIQERKWQCVDASCSLKVKALFFRRQSQNLLQRYIYFLPRFSIQEFQSSSWVIWSLNPLN